MKFTFKKTGGPFPQRLWQCGKHGTGRSPRYGWRTKHQKWFWFPTVSDVFPAAASIRCYCKVLLNTNSPSAHKSAAETRRRRTEKWAKPLQQCPRRESILLGEMRGNCRRKGSSSASASVQLKPFCTFFLNHKTTVWLSWGKTSFTLLLALFHAAV